jgi:glutaredoxin
MLHLYTTTYCPYCKKVIEYLETHHIPFEERVVNEHLEYRDELIALGGKMQIPFLVDTERNVHMYESDAMITYLTEHYPHA